MQSRLSYYSVILLVGLAITSGLVLAMNPFNNPPASASAPTQGAAPAGGAVATNSTTSTSAPGINGLGGVLQPGEGIAGEHHHHDSDSPGAVAGLGNSTVTTTTSGPIYSQNE